MTNGEEFRRHPRFNMSGPVNVVPPRGEAIAGSVQNISLGGILVSLPVELELGEKYQIEITDSRGPFCLKGEAMRVHLPPRTPDGVEATAFKVGFEFVGMDAVADERLRRILGGAGA